MILNNSLINYSYKKIAKQILFRKDPEWVHDSTLKVAQNLSQSSSAKWLINKSIAYKNSNLNQTIDDISYANPIGLAAGWDKDADAVNLMSSIGFGFAEVGSITKESYIGNDYPRLTRLPKSKSILVNYGLKSQGVNLVAKKLLNIHSNIPIGTNIARTNSPDCSNDGASIEDYCYSFEKLKNIGNYFTINISCPNTFGGQPFHEPKRLNRLLNALSEIKTAKPIYLKLSPDIRQKDIQEIVNLSYKFNINGFICSNLTKDKTLNNIYEKNLPSNGGLSGAVVQNISNQLIKRIYKLTGDEKTIIGLGGVFNAEDAWQKIGLGANLVQLITGLIYEGPGIVGSINKQLSKKVSNKGYKNISEARGFLA